MRRGPNKALTRKDGIEMVIVLFVIWIICIGIVAILK